MHDIRPILPELFNDPGSLLYIGARLDACSWLTELYEAGNVITLLEKWWPNLVQFVADGRIAFWKLGDVRRTRLEIFKYICWWHGPEHIPKDDFCPTMVYLRDRTERTLVVSAPWGLYPQGPHEGNPAEIHRWSVYEEDLQDFGFATATDGQKDHPGSHIVGWLRK